MSLSFLLGNVSIVTCILIAWSLAFIFCDVSSYFLFPHFQHLMYFFQSSLFLVVLVRMLLTFLLRSWNFIFNIFLCIFVWATCSDFFFFAVEWMSIFSFRIILGLWTCLIFHLFNQNYIPYLDALEGMEDMRKFEFWTHAILISNLRRFLINLA